MDGLLLFLAGVIVGGGVVWITLTALYTIVTHPDDYDGSGDIE